jgi:hypothetical protein
MEGTLGERLPELPALLATCTYQDQDAVLHPNRPERPLDYGTILSPGRGPGQEDICVCVGKD